MRMIVRLTLLAGIVVANLSAAAIVQFQVTDLGGNLHRYNYAVSGFAFQQNQELAILFAPALYGTLSNGVAGSGFGLLLLQPNNPPGASGDYSALALVNNPSLAGPFRVDFIFKGSGTPGAQPYFINQYDANGNLISVVSSGTTTPLGSPGVPEPGTFLLGSAALLMGAAVRTIRRSRSNTVRQNNVIV